MLDYVSLLPDILSHYAITVRQHEHLRTSENVVVKLQTDDGRSLALRIRKILGGYPRQILSELIVLHEFSRQTRAEVPAPLSTRDGQLYCTVSLNGQDYLCVLFTWVSGRHRGGHEICISEMASMAKSVSMLHRFAGGFQPPADFVRPIYDHDCFFGETSWRRSEAFVARLSPDEAAGLQAMNETVVLRLQAYPRDATTFGLIHYDLHVGNFLFDEGVAHMIDFDECGFGYYLFDLAHILFEFIGDARFPAFREVVTEQYSSARGIEKYDEKDLDLFLALQGVAYANWLYRIFHRDGNVDAMKYWAPIILQRVNGLLG